MCNLLIALIVVSSNQASLCILMLSSELIRLQECYEACLSLNLEDFSLSASINEEEEESAGDDKSLFLEYDRQLMIMARIANFDKAAHRRACRRTLRCISSAHPFSGCRTRCFMSKKRCSSEIALNWALWQSKGKRLKKYPRPACTV
jgi:hypothetical protein